MVPVQESTDVSAVLLPGGNAYEVGACSGRHTIGLALHPQWGDDAIGTDRIRPFVRRAGTLAFVPAGCDVWSRSACGGDYLLLSFDAAHYAGDRALSNVPMAGADQLIRCYRRGEDLSIVLDVLLGNLELAEEVATTPLTATHLEALRRQIIKDPQQPWRVNDMAALLGLSERHFRRRMLAAVGMSPQQWLQLQRLWIARELITCEQLSVTAAALDTGFSSAGHFSRRHSEHFGEPPSALNRQERRRSWYKTQLRNG